MNHRKVVRPSQELIAGVRRIFAVVSRRSERKMRFTVYDLGDNGRRLSVGWTTWRATLELLNRHRVIDKPDLNRLVWRLGGPGTSIPPAQAAAIAEYLKTRLIPTLRARQLITLSVAAM